jgi:hypothetical protein
MYVLVDNLTKDMDEELVEVINSESYFFTIVVSYFVLKIIIYMF